ncbi:SRPBCC family protein [uncultured Eudoraea sp.]|uniref:SRPBCC family protein n=1 Tax=uncultured Eudoraea sp. TaxID=1035614 RepID=UPI00262184B8|nr:SRPBCC family protein [uncultured Eudoraea sp.]
MKHKGSIEINQPLNKVATLFANPENLKEYQDGFVKKELISGKKGEVGAVSKMFYKHGKHKMELVETITKNALPHSFEASYHHKHMDNTMKCNFVALNENKTKYEFEYEYTRINWVIPKLISLLFPSMYRKPAEKWLKQFKEFAERQ